MGSNILVPFCSFLRPSQIAESFFIADHENYCGVGFPDSFSLFLEDISPFNNFFLYAHGNI